MYILHPIRNGATCATCPNGKIVCILLIFAIITIFNSCITYDNFWDLFKIS